MLFKRLVVVILVVFLSACVSVSVWSHCHDSTPCERDNIGRDLVSENKWDNPDDNGYHIVHYEINNTCDNCDGNRPDLIADTDWAAEQWSATNYYGGFIAFKLVKDNDTSNRTPHVKDGKNVIGWGLLPWNNQERVGAEVRRWLKGNTTELEEQDIMVNYEAPYVAHGDGNIPSDKYCLRDTMTHEFGHFQRLKDLNDPSLPGVENADCQDYEHYTMWQPLKLNWCHRESVECEDYWGQKQLYGTVQN